MRILRANGELIVVYLRVPPGKFQGYAKYLDPKNISQIEYGGQYLVKKAGRMGKSCEEWAKLVLESRKEQGLRVIVGLNSLAGNYTYKEIERACAEALSYRQFRLQCIRDLLKAKKSKKDAYNFTQEHEQIRQMDVYEQVVKNRIKGEKV